MQDFIASAEGKADGAAGVADLLSCAAAQASKESKMTAAKIKTSDWLRRASCVIMRITLGSLLHTSEKNSRLQLNRPLRFAQSLPQSVNRGVARRFSWRSIHR
jgi:hypothetical protein